MRHVGLHSAFLENRQRQPITAVSQKWQKRGRVDSARYRHSGRRERGAPMAPRPSPKAHEFGMCPT
jgi:hypothetical protein